MAPLPIVEPVAHDGSQVGLVMEVQFLCAYLEGSRRLDALGKSHGLTEPGPDVKVIGADVEALVGRLTTGRGLKLGIGLILSASDGSKRQESGQGKEMGRL